MTSPVTVAASCCAAAFAAVRSRTHVIPIRRVATADVHTSVAVEASWFRKDLQCCPWGRQRVQQQSIGSNLLADIGLQPDGGECNHELPALRARGRRTSGIPMADALVVRRLNRIHEKHDVDHIQG